MTAVYEVLLLCDRRYEDGFWHLHPEVHDVIGWWRDGSPAWIDHIDLPSSKPIVVDTIPKRQPADDDWLEDDPRVYRLIKIACTLNDVFAPLQGVDLSWRPDETQAAANAALARIRKQFQGDDVERVIKLALQIETARKVAAT